MSDEARLNEKNIKVWLRMYEEQVRHARHHETLRSHSTNLIIAISAAILAFLSANSASTSNRQQCIFGIFIIIVNVYGIFMSLKHYERNQLHIAVSREYREAVS